MITYTRILQAARNLVTNIRGRSGPDKRQIATIYQENDYLRAYSEHTDRRVEADPKSAVGGMWEEISQLQYNFLLSKNLRPISTLLDIGCGTLRGGRYCIRYLDPGNYYGIDISRRAIAYAKQLVHDEGLTGKAPHLIVSENKNLQFHEFAGQTFDYNLAQSVFTHLMPDHIQECFEHIGYVMHTDSVFYFTFTRSEEYKKKSRKDFCYPLSLFEAFADEYGFSLRDCSQEYRHPKGKAMVEIKKAVC